jgi:hypothetical protein
MRRCAAARAAKQEKDPGGRRLGTPRCPPEPGELCCPAPRSPGLARIPPSASRPPSSSPLGPRPRSTSLIFSKLPLPGPFVPLMRGAGCARGFPTPGESVVTVVVGGDRDPGFQSCIVPLPGYKAERPGGARILGHQPSANCWFCSGLCSPHPYTSALQASS